MTDFTADELNRRLTTLHPIARREWARITDNRTYRGRHNIVSEEQTPYLFGLHPLVFIVPAVLALVLMVVDPLAIILGGSQ